MASLLRHRIQSLVRSNRHFYSILSPNSTTPLSSKEKTKAAFSLLKFENNPEKIVEICQEATLIPETHLDRIVFSMAISKLSKSNNFSYIKQFIDEFRSSRPDLRSSERFAAHAIILYGQAGMIDDALRVFTEYHADIVGNSSSTGSVKALNALIFAFILAKDFKEVNRIYLEFPKLYNIEPNLQTYNNVAKAFCESGSSSSCYSVLAEMDRKGVKPNATTFQYLLSGFYMEEKEEDVGKVLEMMKEKYRIGQSVATCNIRIKSLCKLKRSTEAKALLDGMISRGMKPNINTFSHLIFGFCLEGNLEEAQRLFRSMLNSGCKPDAQCYFTLVHYLCEGEDFETALLLCQESVEKGWVPNYGTMEPLVNGLARVGKVQEAKELVGKMKERFTWNVSRWDEVEAGLPQ
ncbi:small ribosomal subunit protein mS86 (rPPR1)-like [Euphorbia lathyris]|uniref:small ribosomal subunit protein mS86 (rPPR1)-like n=1 Tax=Euphorbia lathyris TaxID=212925 RepID=UPI0033143FBC